MKLSEILDTFAAALWAPRDVIEVRALPEPRGTNGSSRKPRFYWPEAGEFPLLAEELEALNRDGYGVFAGISPRRAKGGRKDEDCLPARATWIDFDGITPAEAEERVTVAGLPAPTMTIASGHGCHVYHGFEDQPSIEEIKGLVGDLADHVGSDPSVKNPSRVMRLPGLMNHKPDPATCCLRHVDIQARYRFEELRSLIPCYAAGKAPSRGPSNGGGAECLPVPSRRSNGQFCDPNREAVIERARRYVATVQGMEPGGRTNLAFRVAAALRNDFELSETEALPILEGWDATANNPPIAADVQYGYGELEKILRNAELYSKKAPGSLLNASKFHHTSNFNIPPISVTGDTEPAAGRLAAEFDAEGRGERKTLALPWPRLSDAARALRPGSVTVIGAPTGRGKTYFALEMALEVARTGERFAFLPLEGQKADFERRILANLAGTWDVIDDEGEGAARRREILAAHESKLNDLSRYVFENPRCQIVKGRNGKPTVPSLHYERVLDWIGDAMQKARVVFVDPIAQIDFGPREWEGQKDFMQHATGLSSSYKRSAVLVVHSVKRSGRDGKGPLTEESLQGAAEFSRLADTVLLLDAHDKKSSDVLRCGGCRETVRHDRTVTIGKARFGRGARLRLAFATEGPRFRELGVIAPAKVGSKAPAILSDASSRTPYKD